MSTPAPTDDPGPGDVDRSTAARGLAYWRTWCALPADADSVHVIRFRDDVALVRAPDRLRASIERAAPTTADELVAAIAAPTVRHGAARLTYADRLTFRRRTSDRTVELDPLDPRVRTLRDTADHDQWGESIGDHGWHAGTGLLVGDALVALATYDVWDDAIAHLAVFTAPDERSRGWSTEVASVAIGNALDAGLVAQWRVRIDNTASIRVAEKLGFVTLGHQLFARLRDTVA